MLARLVTNPREAPQLTAGLTPDTFTTDVRYDVYQAIVACADRCGYYDFERLAAELRTRMASVPSYALVNYGGATGLFARAYLARLASTEVGSDAAAATASALVHEDAHQRARPVRDAARAPASAPVAGGDHRQEGTLMAGPPLQQPRPQSGRNDGVTQRL